MRYLVTGGAGFIGSNFIRYLFERHGRNVEVTNLDRLTYAGIGKNLSDLEGKSNYRFVKGDIANSEDVSSAYRGINDGGVDVVVNFAAESHVDRALTVPRVFVKANVEGVLVLLEAARKQKKKLKRFVQVSTDEVYGSRPCGKFKENDPLQPRNAYSASKAGGDRLAYAYSQTHGLPVIVTRASNNFGPWQFPEKLIPLFVTKALDNLPLPLFGEGLNIRDWLFVNDHCAAIDFLIKNGKNSETYNIGGGNERKNRDITFKILKLLGKPRSLIRHVEDRKGHDWRYALDTSKLAAMGFRCDTDFDEAIRRTVQWYIDHESWWRAIYRNPRFKKYMKKQYGG